LHRQTTSAFGAFKREREREREKEKERESERARERERERERAREDKRERKKNVLSRRIFTNLAAFARVRISHIACF
jgi:hypothetical protein